MTKYFTSLKNRFHTSERTQIKIIRVAERKQTFLPGSAESVKSFLQSVKSLCPWLSCLTRLKIKDCNRTDMVFLGTGRGSSSVEHAVHRPSEAKL